VVGFSFVCLLAAWASVGCEGPVPPGQGRGEGPGHRQQQLALSPEQELKLGRKAYKEVLENPREFGKALPVDDPQCERVRTVARKIIRASQIRPLQREINLRQGYRFEWEVTVLQNRQANAFCLPGGKIAVFTGILKIAENDDQLATVLAHEISHALAHHTSERMAREQSQRGILGAFMSKKYDREEESEADHIGLFLMTFAGYNPDQAVRFWERMLRASGGREPPEILSDHPSTERRIQDIKRWVPQAKAAKKAYDEGNIAPEQGR
jgi:predicted Zn-dependent protease